MTFVLVCMAGTQEFYNKQYLTIMTHYVKKKIQQIAWENVMHLVVSKLGEGFLSSSTAFHIQSHKEWNCEKTPFTSGMFDEIFLTKILPPFSRPKAS